jgi:hypothetical protein
MKFLIRSNFQTTYTSLGKSAGFSEAVTLVTYLFKPQVTKGRNNIVGIATGYGLDDEGVGIRVQWGQEFSLLHVVQTGPPSLLSKGYRLGVMRQGREADNSPLASAEDKKMWIYTSTPLYTFMVQSLIS